VQVYIVVSFTDMTLFQCRTAFLNATIHVFYVHCRMEQSGQVFQSADYLLFRWMFFKSVGCCATMKHATHLQTLWKSDSVLKLFYGKCQQNAEKMFVAEVQKLFHKNDKKLAGSWPDQLCKQKCWKNVPRNANNCFYSEKNSVLWIRG